MPPPTATGPCKSSLFGKGDYIEYPEDRPAGKIVADSTLIDVVAGLSPATTR